MVKVNFAEVPLYDPIPPGVYRVVLEGATVRPAISSGAPTVVFLFRITSAMPGGNQSVVGRMIPHTVSLQPQALWNLYRTLVGLGVPEEKLRGEVEIDDDFLASLVGTEAIVAVRQREYLGTITTQVVSVRPPNTATTAPMFS